MLKFDSDRAVVDIIIPTFNNHHFLAQTIRSILRFTNLPFRIFVVNNAEHKLEIEIIDLFGRKTSDLFDTDGYDARFLQRIELGKNMGWQGGINAGVRHIRANCGGLSKYVLFLNDDIQIIDYQYAWLANMVNLMEKYDDCGGVGPISNAVMMRQNLQYSGDTYHEVSVLSGFCFLTSKKIIDEIGLLDENLFGGDDVDYAIRIRNKGYKLLCCRRSFVYHYYAQTGKKLHADWDTREWSEKISKGIIQKHGLKKYLETQEDVKSKWDKYKEANIEASFVRTLIPNNGKVILDMGCGSAKIWPSATGVDIVHNGQYGISGGMRFKPLEGVDINADVSEPMPMFEDGYADYILAKHIIEHVTDYLSTLKEWNRILKPGGKIVIAVPDEDLGEAMTCDPTHVHVFDKESMKSALELTGYKVTNQYGLDGACSIITVAEKV